MKSISIYALTRKQNIEHLQKLEQQLSGREHMLKMKEWELESMRALVERLELHMQDVSALRLFYSFQIPRLGKEFDLLQIRENQIINIELKSGAVSEEAIQKQLIQNRYYLSALGKPIQSYTYISSQNRLMRLTNHDHVIEASWNQSLIRLEADELTYLLHIIIRYELEKDLISGALDVDDLPDAWSSKYEEYLGIRPEHDGEGVLQDIHWAAGYVGFFPSYFMANVTAAQMAAVMAQEIGDLDQLMQQQSFDKINDWLTQNMYCYGAVYSGRELMEKVCRGTFSSTYYIDYLRNKYSEVYKLF